MAPRATRFFALACLFLLIATPVSALDPFFHYQVSGYTVYFVADRGDETSIYVWDFGDGTTSIERNPRHTYRVDWLGQTFSVTLNLCTYSPPHEINGICESQRQDVTIARWDVVGVLGLAIAFIAILSILWRRGRA